MSDYSYDERDALTKIKMGLDKGIRVVSIRTKEVYDTVVIKNRLQSKNKYLKKEKNLIGESVYQMFKVKDKFDVDQIRAKCVEIAKIEQEISDMHEELKLVHYNAQKKLGELKAIAKPKENI